MLSKETREAIEFVRNSFPSANAKLVCSALEKSDEELTGISKRLSVPISELREIGAIEADNERLARACHSAELERDAAQAAVESLIWCPKSTGPGYCRFCLKGKPNHEEGCLITILGVPSTSALLLRDARTLREAAKDLRDAQCMTHNAIVRWLRSRASALEQRAKEGKL